MDDTIERRWGHRISARGIYRDPVRSCHGHFVKASGLRWLSFMVLTPVSGTGLITALPVLTLLAPSEQSNLQRGCRHKLLTDWARQGALQLSRWLPSRQIIFMGDSSFAVHDLAHAIIRRATLISRLRLDANLFALPSTRTSSSLGRPAQKRPALPKLKTLLCNPATSWAPTSTCRWRRLRRDDSVLRCVSSLKAAYPDVFCRKGLRRTQLSHGCPAYVEDQSVDIVGEVGERDLRLGARDADGADEQSHLILLAGEHVLDAGTHGRPGGVGAGGACRHRLAPAQLGTSKNLWPTCS